MSSTYNLVEEAWIPCVTPDGAIKREGVLRTLTGAANYAEIWDASPLVTVALHRMLLAILHRVFGPENPEAWSDLWQNGQGSFDAMKLEAYLKNPAIYLRFDLFDDKHPFFQTASLPLGAVNETTGRPKFVKPIWQMAHELAYSDNMNLFSHFTDNEWEIRPFEEAARWLVAFQSFALGGLITTEEGKKTQDGSADAGQLVKSAVVLAKGENLFQTLMLNLVHYSSEDELPFAFKKQADRPAWERDDETKQVDRRYDGYVDLLTWQSRRVKLVAERDREGNLLGVSGVVTMKGYQLPDNYWRYHYETMVGFVRARDAKGKQEPWPPLGIRVGKALWRDSHALSQTVSEFCQRPRVLSWIDDLRQIGHLTRKQIQLEVAGISANQAKVFLWRHESLPLPLGFLHDANLMEAMKKTVLLAEQVAEALSIAVWRAVATSLKPGKDETRLGKSERDAVKQAVKSLGVEHCYWSRLEEPFRRCILALPDGDGIHRLKVVQQWFTDKLEPSAWDAYQRTAGEMEYSSRALRAAVSGETLLRRDLYRIAADLQIVRNKP
ncbi:MAG: type I-E CRISPR-associated protein Cse1/CasA [Gemmataceae bacterium]